MEMLATILGYVTGLVSFICYVLVLIKMFQNGKTVLGIVCIVLLFCCGIGCLIAFIYGWVQAKTWNITNIMTVWTVSTVLGLVSGVVNPAPYRQIQEMMRLQRGN